MIPNNVYDYCCEDISLIENYEKAIADESQTWHCHHRKETDEGFSQKQLIEMGLYFNRPASELIFLTPAEHQRLHLKGKPNCNKGKKIPAISIALKGKKNPKVSAALKGRKQPNVSKALKGKKRPPFSAEHCANISAAKKGHSPWNKGKKMDKPSPLKGKPKTKYKWLTPDGEIKIMDAAKAIHWHPDWVRIEKVD